jgi:hypothetical protein
MNADVKAHHAANFKSHYFSGPWLLQRSQNVTSFGTKFKIRVQAKPSQAYSWYGDVVEMPMTYFRGSL